MKGSASACLLTLGASVAAGSSCTNEQPGATVDLLARRPDDDEGAVGAHGGPVERRTSLEPGAVVRYRIEPIVAGEIRLAAHAAGEGTLEAAWFAIDLRSEEATPGQRWQAELTGPGDIERTYPLPSAKGLVELRLVWRAPPGGAELELRELALEEEERVERPSILLVIVDTLSAEHLSAYGYPLETDPELRRFASEACLFERCFANAPWTVPSFMSLMTGLYSRAHELDPSGTELWDLWFLAPNRWTLAETLRAAGYRTAAFVDNPWLTDMLGLHQGFDVFDASATDGAYSEHDNPDGGIRRTTSQARAFLGALPPDAPFFAFVHAFDVHGPYSMKPPDEERARGTEPYDAEHTAPSGGSSWTYGIVPTYIAAGTAPGGTPPNPMHTAPIERAYDEGVRFVDEELGKFFDDLRATGVLERSWVVVTADHGETMSGATHLFGHGLLDQAVMHVPLVIRPPGGIPGGRRIDEVVQLADLYPTLIEVAGLAERNDCLHGRSLVPLLRDEEHRPGVVLSETGISRQAMLVSEGWKLVELEPTEQVAPESLISHPYLIQNYASIEKRLRKQVAESRASLGMKRQMGRLFDWKNDAELRRDFFERMPETGLTEELLAQMKTRTGYHGLLAFIERALGGHFYQLYDLEQDPGAAHDVAAEHPEKVEELKALLEREQRRRTQAWRLARPPRKAVEIPEEDVRALEALGYGGAGENEGE
jgi:arylsulfatase A-like enzyme